MNYMEKERDHFSQFVIEEFSEYIKRKRHDTVFGNHLELQAIAELYNRPILIYTIDAEPIKLFQEEYQTDNPPMLLSYHHGNHYNSVYDPNKPTFGVGLGLPGLDPGSADRQIIHKAILESEQQEINQQLEQDTMKESEQQDLNDHIINLIKKNTENDDIESKLIEAQIMESVVKESFNNDETMESDYLEMMLLEQVKRDSWTDNY